MIKVSFIASNRDVIYLIIDNRKIVYFDKIWTNGIQFMPKDHQLILKLMQSSRKLPYATNIISWINDANSGKNLEEYNQCKSDEELAELVKRDGKEKGLLEVKA